MRKLKTEHSGGKNGGGHWGSRQEAKTLSKKVRRARGRRQTRNSILKVDPREKLLAFRPYSGSSTQLSEIKKLFKACSWDWLEPDSEMSVALENSYMVYLGYASGKLVGFARVLSDTKVYGLLVDLMIDPDFRTKGFGRGLLTHVLDDARAKGIKIIQLLSSKEGKSLYRKLEFKECPAESPGMIKFLTDQTLE